jgi:peptidyl-prolyl cis-trans isomerase B (cyclophilin B)
MKKLVLTACLSIPLALFNGCGGGSSAPSAADSESAPTNAPGATTATNTASVSPAAEVEPKTPTNTAAAATPATPPAVAPGASPTESKSAPSESSGSTQPQTAQTEPPNPDEADEVAVLQTNFGQMVVEFWPDVAPKAVENFKKLAKDGFYNGTGFHRVIKGFMIQGGDPLTKDPANEPDWGTGGPGYNIKAEFNDRPHVRGVLSMARGPNPDSAGSQFFICLGPASSLNHQYTAFGKLVKGDDVLGKIGDVAVKADKRGEMSRPVDRVHLESVRIVSRESAGLK